MDPNLAQHLSAYAQTSSSSSGRSNSIDNSNSGRSSDSSSNSNSQRNSLGSSSDSSYSSQEGTSESSRSSSSSMSFEKNTDEKSNNNTTEPSSQKGGNNLATSPHTSAEQFNKKRVKEFFIRVARASMRHNIRLGARQQFHDHVERIRSTAKKGVQEHHDFDSEIDELKKKVAHLIEVERNPYSPQKNEELKRKIVFLENQIQDLIKTKKVREDRFVELEKKINSKITKNNELMKHIERKLLTLEHKLVSHKLSSKKGKNKVNKEYVSEIEKQISETKRVLDTIRKSPKKLN